MDQEFVMYIFLVPLMFGFSANLVSAFAAAFSSHWGERHSVVITAILRDILGIPIWVLGFVLAYLASSPVLFEQTMGTKVVGWWLIANGGLIILVALVTIRIRAAVPSTQDALAQNGLYAYVRHPIHAGTILEFVGLLLISGRQTVVIACVLGIGWVLLQTRFEECDLLQRFPEYGEYMRRVPRYIPQIRRR